MYISLQSLYSMVSMSASHGDVSTSCWKGVTTAAVGSKVDQILVRLWKKRPNQNSREDTIIHLQFKPRDGQYLDN